MKNDVDRAVTVIASFVTHYIYNIFSHFFSRPVLQMSRIVPSASYSATVPATTGKSIPLVLITVRNSLACASLTLILFLFF